MDKTIIDKRKDTTAPATRRAHKQPTTIDKISLRKVCVCDVSASEGHQAIQFKVQSAEGQVRFVKTDSRASHRR